MDSKQRARLSRCAWVPLSTITLATGEPRAGIVAVSGYGQSSDRQRTREAGFDEHFTKPVALEALLDVVNRAD